MAAETNTAVSVIERASLALGAAEHEKKLVALAKTSVGITSITNAAGYQECHSVRMTLKKARIEIERTGKTARDDAVAFSKAVIAEERRLIGIIEPEEARLQGIQDAHDAKIEAERQAKAKAEAERVAAINKRIDWIRSNVAACINKPAAFLAETIETLSALPLTAELYAELLPAAQGAAETTLTTLREMHATAVANEVEAARLKAEREEFARQKAAQEATAVAERARLAEEERAAKAKRDEEARVERKRLDEEARIAREAREAADAKAKAEREAADKVAREERAKEATALAEKQRVEREERAAEQRRIDEANAALAAREKAARDEEARQQAERERVAREAREREEAAARAEAKRKADEAQADAEKRAKALRLEALRSTREAYPTPELALTAILELCESDLSDAEARDAIAVIAEAHAQERIAA